MNKINENGFVWKIFFLFFFLSTFSSYGSEFMQEPQELVTDIFWTGNLNVIQNEYIIFNDEVSFYDFIDSKGLEFLHNNVNNAQTSSFIVISLGKRNTGGYEIVLENSELIENEIVLTLSQKKPPKNSINIQVITYPTIIIQLNMKNMPIKIIWSE